MRKIIYSVFLGILLCAGIANVNAMPIDIDRGLVGGSGGLDEVLFGSLNPAGGATNIYGLLNNDTDDQVDFYSDPSSLIPELLVSPSGGQARIEAVDGSYDYLYFEMNALPGFEKVQFNIDALLNGDITILLDWSIGGVPQPSQYSEDFTVGISGANQFTAWSDSSSLELITGVTIVGDADLFNKISQFRIGLGGTQPVPEPVTMLLMGAGLAGIASTRLRRKK